MDRRAIIRFTTLLFFVFVVMLLSTAIGGVSYSPITVLQSLFSKSDSISVVIIRDLRFPRALLGFIVGAALAASGAAYQSLFRNPLADPYIIGSASGAALGATSIIALRLSSSMSVPLGAFAGSLLAAGAVYFFVNLGRSRSLVHLLLAGAAMSSFLSALVWLVLATRDQNAMQVLAWLMGNIAGKSWGGIGTALPFCFVGFIMLIVAARALDAFACGVEAAQGLGLPIRSATLWIVTAASLATAGAVAAGGIIGFVGMIAPHIARRFVGPTHRVLIPASALCGGLLLILADLAARTLIAPVELPVGVVTAVVGAPLFLFILWNYPRQ